MLSAFLVALHRYLATAAHDYCQKFKHSLRPFIPPEWLLVPSGWCPKPSGTEQVLPLAVLLLRTLSLVLLAFSLRLLVFSQSLYLFLDSQVLLQILLMSGYQLLMFEFLAWVALLSSLQQEEEVVHRPLIPPHLKWCICLFSHRSTWLKLVYQCMPVFSDLENPGIQ